VKTLSSCRTAIAQARSVHGTARPRRDRRGRPHRRSGRTIRAKGREDHAATALGRRRGYDDPRHRITGLVFLTRRRTAGHAAPGPGTSVISAAPKDETPPLRLCAPPSGTRARPFVRGSLHDELPRPREGRRRHIRTSRAGAFMTRSHATTNAKGRRRRRPATDWRSAAASREHHPRYDGGPPRR